MPKYVCLEGIQEQNRFYTMHDENRDERKLHDGTIAYKILGYAETDEEARVILYGPNHNDPFEKAVRFSDYLMKMPYKEMGMSEDDIYKMAVLLANK